ncbi:HpcH/HpaI aldolase/citrate lyase family protein [Paraburkholderia dipogonis]|nr:CoA ester lyase [Paraburkholderia dipogonis]
MTNLLMTAIREARTFLFVPGNRPERFSKAAASAADVIVLDLEDSVPPQDKEAAREAIAAALPALIEQRTVMIRINALRTDVGRADVAWAATHGHGVAIMVSKADDAGDLVAALARLPRCPLMPLIESVDGYAGLDNIAQVAGVARLSLGTIDFMVDADMQCDAQETQLAPLRFATAMASRRYGLAGPVDGVTVNVSDIAHLTEDTMRALRFGFGGKLCIHPAQIGPVHAALSPSRTELDWARRVIDMDQRSGGAAVQLDGRMVDAPVVAQARRLLARAPKE